MDNNNKLDNNDKLDNDTKLDNNDKLENDIKMLMRHTTYTYNESKNKLLNLLTVDECIKEYLGIKEKEPIQKSVNQNIFKVIREFF